MMMRWSDLMPGDKVKFIEKYAISQGVSKRDINDLMLVRGIIEIPNVFGQLRDGLRVDLAGTHSRWQWTMTLDGRDPYTRERMFEIVELADDNEVE